MLYLASKSPRRSQILRQIGVRHQLLHLPPEPGEDEPHFPGESPGAYVRRTALEKARQAIDHVLNTNRENQANMATVPLLVADTCVSLAGEVLGKPASRTEAVQTLQTLSGTTHQVETAVIVAFSPGTQRRQQQPQNEPAEQSAFLCVAENYRGYHLLKTECISKVTFRTLSQAEIEHYCDTGEPYGKAGAYGIQGHAAVFITRLDGSYTGVMGLPAAETWYLLMQGGHIS